ncbi:MAG: glutamate-5-semialdehyde dehydrogenase [Myxococcota bacterium]
MSEIDALVERCAKDAKEAARTLAIAPTPQKNAALLRAAEGFVENADALIEANRKDLATAERMELSAAMLDRLRLDAPRIEAMVEGVRQVAALPDPVGAVAEERTLENGLKVTRVRAPLGLIGIIYESRPNVTADAAALCIKSGNAVLLRGGKEAFESNKVIASIVSEALEAEGLPAAGATLLPTTDRRATLAMIGLDGVVDLVIPRGGEGLIRFVAEHSRVPVVQHYKGVCHVYVADDADLEMALAIADNAKTHRPGVCDAMETLLVDQAVAREFLPQLAARFGGKVELRGDDATRGILSDAKPASDADWDTEYLEMVLAVRVVKGIDEAIAHVAKHGSQHTEAIVTTSEAKAQRWVREVDASLVLVNASTRFNDGYQLGLGAEMGISTTKLHAYGPMGLQELCTLRWVAYGQGQIRA